jgi:signal transduction histidine kinase
VLGAATVTRLQLGIVDAGLALGLLGLAELQLGVYTECCNTGSTTLTGVLLTAAETLPIACRRRSPGFILLVVGAAAIAQVVLRSPVTDFGTAGVLAAVFTVAADSSQALALLVAALTPVGISAVALLARSTPPHELLVIGAQFAAAWALGQAVRYRRGQVANRAVRFEREKEEAAHEAAAAERGRIAREMHDVVAHSLSLITIQAGAARSVLDTAPERLGPSLLTIETLSREAWAEIRQFLDPAGRDAGADAVERPRPGLANLPDLIQRFEDAGLSVDLTVTGEARLLPVDADLCAYRIVQESLTNTLRHAGQVQARVSIGYGDHSLRVEIASVGPAVPGSPADSGHLGLVGMRERVRLAGGTLSVEDGRGSFTVRAFLPMLRG